MSDQDATNARREFALVIGELEYLAAEQPRGSEARAAYINAIQQIKGALVALGLEER